MSEYGNCYSHNTGGSIYLNSQQFYPAQQHAQFQHQQGIQQYPAQQYPNHQHPYQQLLPPASPAPPQPFQAPPPLQHGFQAPQQSPTYQQQGFHPPNQTWQPQPQQTVNNPAPITQRFQPQSFHQPPNAPAYNLNPQQPSPYIYGPYHAGPQANTQPQGSAVQYQRPFQPSTAPAPILAAQPPGTRWTGYSSRRTSPARVPNPDDDFPSDRAASPVPNPDDEVVTPPASPVPDSDEHATPNRDHRASITPYQVDVSNRPSTRQPRRDETRLGRELDAEELHLWHSMGSHTGLRLIFRHGEDIEYLHNYLAEHPNFRNHPGVRRYLWRFGYR